jgi:hypothetical protein
MMIATQLQSIKMLCGNDLSSLGRAWQMVTRYVTVYLKSAILEISLQDTFTEGNYRFIFGLGLDVLLRPWEKFIMGLKFSEVSGDAWVT